MFPFSSPLSPFVRSQLASQASYFNELSMSLANSFQNVFQANLQLGQSMFDDTLTASQHMLTPDGAKNIPAMDASPNQPASDTLRAYQQRLSRLAADSHVDLARITQQHVEETSRTAQALSEEVTRAATDATGRSLQRQEEPVNAFHDAFEADAASRGNKDAQAKAVPQRSGVNLQADDSRGGSSYPGNAQGTSPLPTQPTHGKHAGKPG